MTFPLMPLPQGARFLKGGLLLRGTAAGAIPVGNPSEDRWLIVVGATFNYDDGSSAWLPPTVNGLAMTELVQDYSNALNDNHRGAIWARKIPTGTQVTLAKVGGPTINRLGVFTLTGVRDAVNGKVLSAANTAPQAAATGAATLGYFVCSQGATVTSVNEMTLIGGGTSDAIGYDEAMSAASLNYTVTHGGTLMFQRKISWPFNY